MVDLDDLEELKKLDPKNVLDSTGMLVNQCRQIWEQTQNLEFSPYFKSIQNIVVCGMGGSAYGGYVVSSLFKDQLKVPVLSNNDYHLPSFVSRNSLIILSSYSGTTEEVFSCRDEAIARDCKITGITSGGALGEFFEEKKLPSLIFDPQFNPSEQPRLGTGYMILGTIGILNKLGVIEVSNQEVREAISELETAQESIKTKAKELAEMFHGNIPLIIASEFLSGNAHILRNQFNETAKSFSSFSLLSELNHHLMEGLKNPIDKKLMALFISSDKYSDKIKKRQQLTKDVVEKNGIKWEEYKVSGSTKLSQVLNVLSFGGYISFYLAMLYGQDPSLIPWVDYFKRELEK